MESEARELLRELREDHRNMAVILDLLEGVVQQASAGKDPDFELVGEIMRYMTVYPDAVHHPKEDVIYDRLREERPDIDAIERQRMLDQILTDLLARAASYGFSCDDVLEGMRSRKEAQ